MKKTHFYSTFILISFFMLTSIIVVFAGTTESIVLAFGIPTILGVIFSLMFYYVFSHEDVFPFARELETTQRWAEKKWLKVIPKLGKTSTALLLGVLGGPILNAFSVRFLLPSYSGKYFLLIFSGALSGLFVVALARGVFGSIVRPLLNF